MNIQQCLVLFQQSLTQAGVDNPSLDVRLLVAAALRCDRASLIAQSSRELSKEETVAIESLIRRRCDREPVARILGYREFWGLSFELNEATLEPRPDSETLITAALDKMTSLYQARKESGFRILDLGTGSGCLLLALLSEWKYATGTGVDKSPSAVEQATRNAQTLELGDRARFQTGDWLAGLHTKYDVIISNPPYIPSSIIAELQPEVRLYDPMIALDGSDDGLSPYTSMIPNLSHYLNDGAGVFFEVGKGQAADVASLLQNAGFSDISILRDYGNVERVVNGRWHTNSQMK